MIWPHQANVREDFKQAAAQSWAQIRPCVIFSASSGTAPQLCRKVWDTDIPCMILLTALTQVHDDCKLRLYCSIAGQKRTELNRRHRCTWESLCPWLPQYINLHYTMGSRPFKNSEMQKFPIFKIAFYNSFLTESVENKNIEDSTVSKKNKTVLYKSWRHARIFNKQIQLTLAKRVRTIYSK